MNAKIIRWISRNKIVKLGLLGLLIWLTLNTETTAQILWKRTNISNTGSVISLAINSNGDILAGTTGGVFRSTDNGKIGRNSIPA